MRIGIITFTSTVSNYGQVLQAYALQRYLKDCAHDPYFVRFDTRIPTMLEKMRDNISILLERLHIIKIFKPTNRGFNAFRHKHTQNSSIYHRYEDLSNVQADLYITGSDQVWAMPLSCKENEFFYLGFVSDNIKKVSYAASFGTKIYNPIYLPRLKQLLSRFDNISVREDEGIDICESIGLEAKCVLDPTMLFNGDFYRNYFKCKKICTNTAFVYHLNIDSEDAMYWSAVHTKLNCKNILATNAEGGKIPALEVLNGVHYIYPTPVEWIEHIDCSDIVLTTSFHGMIFSILMHTKFIIFLKRGAKQNTNSRITSLLGKLGLDKCIINTEDDIDVAMQYNIDWDDVDSRLDILREQSRGYLQAVLN